MEGSKMCATSCADRRPDGSMINVRHPAGTWEVQVTPRRAHTTSASQPERDVDEGQRRTGVPRRDISDERRGVPVQPGPGTPPLVVRSADPGGPETKQREAGDSRDGSVPP